MLYEEDFVGTNTLEYGPQRICITGWWNNLHTNSIGIRFDYNSPSVITFTYVMGQMDGTTFTDSSYWQHVPVTSWWCHTYRYRSKEIRNSLCTI